MLRVLECCDQGPVNDAGHSTLRIKCQSEDERQIDVLRLTIRVHSASKQACYHLGKKNDEHLQ